MTDMSRLYLCVHNLAPVGNKYDQGEPKIREQDTLVEKSTTEVKEPESDIHSKPLSNSEIHLLVPSNFDDKHSNWIPKDSVTLR